MIKNSPEYIRQLLLDNPAAVERAIVVIYNRQTVDEQLSGRTKHLNGVGFSAADDHLGSYLARWINSGNHLSGQWLTKGRILILKYVSQLVEEATIKMQRMRQYQFQIEREIAEEQAILESEAFENAEE